MARLIAIDDPADPRIAVYRDVRERDLVGRDGLFVAEGKVVLEKLVDSRQARPQSLLIADKRVAALAPLLDRLPGDLPVYTAGQAVLDAVAGFPLHRGILAIGRRIDPPSPDRALADAAALGRDVLLLSAIANHDNMGGIFRNAAGFGLGAVLLDRDCCDPLYRKAIRVSVGATLLVPFARLAAEDDPLALLDAHGFAPLALSPQGSERLADLRAEGRQAVLLGAEGPGLSPALLARTRSVRIDMADGFDSLNVATTSGIVLHHLATRSGSVAAGNQAG